MTYENLIKNKIQYVIGGLFDKLSIERKLTDAQMEFMQFGICDYVPRQVEEVPYLIINFFTEVVTSFFSPIQEIH